MTFFRLLTVAGIVSLFASVGFADTAANTSRSTSSHRPQRLQVSASARPVATQAKTAQHTVRSSAKAGAAKVAPTSYHEHSVIEGEVIHAPGEVIMGQSVVGHSGMLSSCDTTCVPCASGWYAGFEATFLMPRFGENVAYTLMESDGTSFESISDVSFDHNLQFTPRVFAGVQLDERIGFRATWWLFDHEADSLSQQPPANGFGEVSPPAFGDIDIATTIPGSEFSANSSLRAYTIDLELTKQAQISIWQIGVAGGVRFAEINQTYRAETRDNTGTRTGAIDYSQGQSAFGPTISLHASLPITRRASLFVRGRGSLLFGESDSTLRAGEDLDLMNPFLTTRTTSSDDLLPIGEIQLGLALQGQRWCNVWQPFATIALEGQHWSGVGNATSQDGDLGFFGFSAAAGLQW